MNINTFIRRYHAMSRNWQRVLIVGIASIVIVIAIIGLRSGGVSAGTVAVTRGTITQVVSVTGRIKPVQEVQLAFQNSGRVARVDAKIGARVVVGQLLASLDNTELFAQLRDAQANVLGQQAKLQNIEGGGRAEEIAIKESELRSARQVLDNAYANVYDVLSDAYTKTDNAMRIQLLAMFNNYGTESTPLFGLTFSCLCDQRAQATTTSRATAEIGLNRWKQDLISLADNPSPDAYIKAIRNARGYLQSAKDTIAMVGSLLDDPTVVLSSTTISAYRTSVSTGRASVVAAVTAVNTQDQLITTNKLTVQRIESELALTKAGSTPEEVDTQRAAVMSAQAQADGILAQINKGVIRSPIAGIVTKQDAKVGQTATANQTLVAVISDRELEIEANVPEVDIGRVSVGDTVQLTVDALPGDTFSAAVSFIDPAETIIDGVVNFRVLMYLDVPGERLKSGLTANLDIESLRKEDALILPQFAVIENDQGTFVLKVTDGVSVQVPVTLGIRGQDGTVEILSGLQEGDQVENIGLKTP